MDTSKYRCLARFSNGLMQIEEIGKGKNSDRNKYLIVDKNFNPIVDEYFSGVVPLNEKKFEVFKDDSTKSGIFDLDEGLDWDIKAPRVAYNEAYTTFSNLLEQELEKLVPSCFCEYPRILDYLINRHSKESGIIRRCSNRIFLKRLGNLFDKELLEEITFFLCKNCGSEYKKRYRERRTDSFEVVAINTKRTLGKEVKEFAPNYLNALFDELYYNKSYIFRRKLYKASEKEMIEYLFEKK